MIDTATYTQLQQDVGDDLAKQLLQVYITESRQIVADLADATKQSEIEINAHSLKSSSRSYGALAVGGLAEQIEQKAKEKSNPAAPNSFKSAKSNNSE